MNELHYNKVKLFNQLGGNLDKVTLDSLALQLDLTKEEYLETVQAFDDRNAVELVDGVIDTLFVAMGMYQKLEALGVDMNEAFNRVCDNNLSKFMPYEPNWQQQMPEGCIPDVQDGRLIFKDAVTGKIKKPLNFTPVDLTDIVPDFFQQIGGEE